MGTLPIFGVGAAFARQIAIATFIVFACFSFMFAIQGRENCGCLGAIAVDPWIMLFFDVFALIALFAWNPVPQYAVHIWARKNIGPLILSLVSIVVVVTLARGPETVSFVDMADTVDANTIVVIDPTKWIGKNYPLGEFTSPKPDLSIGDWVVVLYHDDCNTCLDLIELLASQRSSEAKAKMPRVLLIEVNAQPGLEFDVLRGFEATQLLPVRDWFVAAPVRIEISDGIVQRVVGQQELKVMLDAQK